MIALLLCEISEKKFKKKLRQKLVSSIFADEKSHVCGVDKYIHVCIHVKTNNKMGNVRITNCDNYFLLER